MSASHTADLGIKRLQFLIDADGTLFHKTLLSDLKNETSKKNKNAIILQKNTLLMDHMFSEIKKIIESS